MNKKGQVTLYIIIAVLLVAAIVFTVLIFKKVSPNSPQCQTDADCVPAECCHPTTCTAAATANVCSINVCDTACAPGSLDCGQGSCQCVNNKCNAVFS